MSLVIWIMLVLDIFYIVEQCLCMKAMRVSRYVLVPCLKCFWRVWDEILCMCPFTHLPLPLSPRILAGKQTKDGLTERMNEILKTFWSGPAWRLGCLSTHPRGRQQTVRAHPQSSCQERIEGDLVTLAEAGSASCAHRPDEHSEVLRVRAHVSRAHRLWAGHRVESMARQLSSLIS